MAGDDGEYSTSYKLVEATENEDIDLCTQILATDACTVEVLNLIENVNVSQEEKNVDTAQ